MKNDAKKIDGAALVRGIPQDWLAPTLEIAQVMAAAGHRVWIVGGGVRDLILGRPIKDIDLVSAALPDEVEGLFERTVPVGKAFGIVVVVLAGKEIELATFRKERGYSDSRRPDEIEYADTPEVDSGRRDFTCNALYLDPLTGEIEDPTGGMGDLAARQLRAVGEPAERFREDGLRLLRAGRFLAALDLEPAPGLLASMGAEVESIGGVSPERVLDEVSKIMAGADPARAVRVLSETKVFGHCLPGWNSHTDGAQRADVLALCLPSGRRGSIPPAALGLAALLDPGAERDDGGLLGRLDQLKMSKELRGQIMSLVRLRWELLEHAERPIPVDDVERGEWVAVARDPAFEAGATLALAWAGEARADLASALDGLRQLSAAAPVEPIELSSGDAMALGVAPGPALGAMLRRAKMAALGGAFATREEALTWLKAQVV